MKSDLPDRLTPYASRIVGHLRLRRDEGVYYPGHGITAKDIARGYNEEYKLDLTDRDVRRIIQYARNNVPEGNRIGGTPDEGYYFCLNLEELRGTIRHLVSEIATRQATISKLKEAFTEQPELF